MAPKNKFKLKMKNAVRASACWCVDNEVEINILTLTVALKYIGQMFRLNFWVFFSDKNE